MIRLTRKVFTDLAIWMILFGMSIGIVFPPFSMMLGIPSGYVLTPVFFIACILAGIIVGAVNISLARVVVGRRLRLLAERMRLVAANLQTAGRTDDFSNCTPDHCQIAVDSEDEIGDSTQAFNNLVQTLAASLETETAVRSFTEMLTSQLEVDSLAAQAMPKLIHYTNADGGVLLVENNGELAVSTSHGIRSPELLIGNDHIRQVLRTEKGMNIRLPENIVLEGVLADFRPREVLIEPILYRETVLGAVVLAKSSVFQAEELTRLELFRKGLGLALQNALIYDRLQRLAALDPLTGAYNRRFGLARLHEEFGRAVRINAPLGVLMFDLDHFKNVNDTYGHLVGDRVLTRIAKIARSVMRDGDILVRYGGEEFLAILPAAAKEDAAQVAERFRRKVEEVQIVDGEDTIHVTVSAGVTAYPEVDISEEAELIGLADKALYQAKETGRNRVMSS
jgi:two-component system cell cycle response regulator